MYRTICALVICNQKRLSQNVTFLQVLEKGSASLPTKEMSSCYATLVLRCFMQNLEEWTNQVLLPSHESSFPYEIVVKLKRSSHKH